MDKNMTIFEWVNLINHAVITYLAYKSEHNELGEMRTLTEWRDDFALLAHVLEQKMNGEKP